LLRGLTQERLKELIHYDPEIGVFTWLVDRGPARKGALAVCICCEGYLHIRVDGVLWKAHRLAFLYMTGSFPEGFIDHADGDESNNKWVNLRPATQAQNQQNTPRRPVSKSGYKGVCWFSPARMWVAKIQANGTQHTLSYFKCPREAAHAYNKAAIELHGEFSVLNPIGD
jgi:hypothetical protein